MKALDETKLNLSIPALCRLRCCRGVELLHPGPG
jgi:hypothetical protein